MHAGQLTAYNKIHNAIFLKTKPNLHAVLGQAGSGKSTLFREIQFVCQQHGKTALLFATTGIAVTLFEGAETVHTGFGIRVPLDERGSTIHRGTARENALRDAAVLIIDEVSLLSSSILKVIDVLLRELMGVNEPFGGYPHCRNIGRRG